MQGSAACGRAHSWDTSPETSSSVSPIHDWWFRAQTSFDQPGTFASRHSLSSLSWVKRGPSSRPQWVCLQPSGLFHPLLMFYKQFLLIFSELSYIGLALTLTELSLFTTPLKKKKEKNFSAQIKWAETQEAVRGQGGPTLGASKVQNAHTWKADWLITSMFID